jgi:phenylacetate-CoA ligase
MTETPIYIPASFHKDLTNKTYSAWRQFLKTTDHWTKEQIDQYQLKELQRIIQYAYKNTPGYCESFDEENLKPAHIKTLNDIERIPFINKEKIRDRLEDFSVLLEGREYVTTGGSTGIPFGFYRDSQSFSKELASKAHQYSRIGWKEGDPQMVFRGLPINTPDHTQYFPEYNELRCSSYYLTPEIMEVYRQKAWEYRPDWIRCYPSSGCIFAKYLEETSLPFPSVKGILCASENIYDSQKNLLKNVFKTRVFSHYGHYELATLAGYCEYADTYHVLPFYGYAELIDSRGNAVTVPGKMGEIVATSFIMHATPFIRYRTGDLALFKGWNCPDCGRPYQIWERIEGRLQEFIVTGSGRYISMTAINFHDNIFDSIKQFQFYQELKGVVVFRYIPKDNCSNLFLSDVKNRLLEKFGADIELIFECVSEIPVTNRGKHRFLIQKLPLDYHDF